MIVSELTELRVIDVFDRGEPNKECVAIKIYETLNIGRYGIMLGSYAGGNSAVPYRDQLYWFGNGFVKAEDWIFVYTGSGEPRKALQQNSVNHTYTVYWGRPTTLFADSHVVPMLIRIDAVDVLQPKGNLPQLGQT